MKKKLFLMGMLATVLAFGLVFTGCDLGNDLSPPAAPNVIAESSATTITFTWDAAASDVIDYRISRSDSAEGPFVNQGAINAPSVITQFTITTGLLPDTTYYFRIIATNGAGSSRATELAVTTLAEDVLDSTLDAPANFRVTATTPGSVTLAHDAVSGAVTYALAFANNAAGPWTNHSTGGLNRNISGLTLNTRYYFRVRTVSSTAFSEWSTVINATTPGLNAVTNITANSITASGMRITWDSVVHVTAYQVQRATTAEGPWVNVTTATSSLFVDATGLPVNSANYFRVRAATGWTIDDYNSSEWVIAGPFTTLPPPTAPIATATWVTGNATNANRVFWYTFDVVEGQQYFIWANTSWSGDGTTTAPHPTVNIRDSDDTVIFGPANPQWVSPNSFVADQTGTVTLELSFTSNGTFAIAYTIVNERP